MNCPNCGTVLPTQPADPKMALGFARLMMAALSQDKDLVEAVRESAGKDFQFAAAKVIAITILAMRDCEPTGGRRASTSTLIHMLTNEGFRASLFEAFKIAVEKLSSKEPATIDETRTLLEEMDELIREERAKP